MAMSAELKRQLGIGGALLLGLGSIIGSGLFVSLGLGTEIAGGWIYLAIILAGLLAICNGLSSSQLATVYPISGGTYEYGYRVLHPLAGFTAGWMFLSAKSASAATAAMAFAAYFSQLVPLDATAQLSLAIGAVVILTGVVAYGVKRGNTVNLVLLSVVALGVLVFAAMIFSHEPKPQSSLVNPPMEAGVSDILLATALIFVAYTGYGRIATMGEEVLDPRGTIPKAIFVTVSVSAAVYLLVSYAGIYHLGPEGFGAAAQGGKAPLSETMNSVAEGQSGFQYGAAQTIIMIAAAAAMLGVLLNLVFGLSRVVLAMARRGDMPVIFSKIHFDGTSPVPAVILTGVIIAGIALVGSIKTAWTFSAVTVLIYYGFTNLSALLLKTGERFIPKFVSVLGMVGCLGLSLFIDVGTWMVAGGVIAVGLLWFGFARLTNGFGQETAEDKESS